MFKQVFLFDGTPYLAFLNEDGEYDYPQDEWTEVAPPEGIYSPFYFNGNEWIGSTKEEYEKTLPKEEEVKDTNTELIAQTQMQLAEVTYKNMATQEQLAQAQEEIKTKDASIQKLEEQQANILLQLAELKEKSTNE